MALFNNIITAALSPLIQLWVMLYSSRAYILRAVACLVIGFCVLLIERTDNFDERMRMRGSFLKSSEIVLVLISEEEWMQLRGRGFQTLRPLKELESATDSFFSDAVVWNQILHSLWRYKPSKVGVAFFLTESSAQYAPAQLETIKNTNIYWAARLDDENRLQRPRALSLKDDQLGIVDLDPDADGTLRRIPYSTDPLPTLPLKLANVKKKKNILKSDSERFLINYQGPAGSFVTFTATELLFGSLPAQAIAGKTVIIGAKGIPSHMHLTPMGPMTRAEVLANVTHNLNHRQQIHTYETWMYALILLGLIVLCAWITLHYGQVMTLTFLCFIIVSWVAFSTWVFDSFYLWIPVLSPVVVIATTFVVFLSYQLITNEKEKWQLRQEKRYLEEVEEIKNNFLSLVSHDLKTPVAKIQSVIEKLSSRALDEQALSDLKLMKDTSQDLHRYIQSLLQVIRIESTGFEARKTPTDINEVILKVADALKLLIQEKSQTLELKLEPLFSIEVDPTLIHEVVLNFIENAIKYTPEGGRIEVISQEIDDNVIVKIRDNGKGISPDETLKVWNKFYRSRGHEGTKGSGLGLYLSRYFIELHGGSVFLNSTVGSGTEVGFSLPTKEDVDGSKT